MTHWQLVPFHIFNSATNCSVMVKSQFFPKMSIFLRLFNRFVFTKRAANLTKLKEKI